MAIELGDNIKLGLGLPNDARYFNTTTNKPWTGVTEVNSALLGGAGGVRYSGLTVNIGGVEYWYKNGIGDGDLILKTTGGGSATSGENITKNVTQASHGFAVKDFIGWSGGTYNKAIADGLYDGEFIGLVTSASTNSFNVTQSGYVTGLTGLVTNTTYFLSESTAGLITDTAPTGDTQINKAVLIANSTTSGWVLPYAGFVVTSGDSGGGNLNWEGNTANALGTYVDEFTVCAQPNLTFENQNLIAVGTANDDDIEIRARNLVTTGDTRGTVLAQTCDGGLMGMFAYGSGHTGTVFGESASGATLFWADANKLMIGTNDSDAPVKIYHAGEQRIATTSDGVDVSGDITVSTKITSSVNNSCIDLYGGASTGARVLLHGSTHATLANRAYYDASLHSFRTTGFSTIMSLTEGSVNVLGGLTVCKGGGALTLSENGDDHTYMQFYADSGATSTRSGYFGYGSAGSAILRLVNERTDADICIDTNGTGQVIMDTIRLNTGAGAGCVLQSDGSGNASWATPSGGGGIAMSGSTVDGITTYVDSSTICSEPNVTIKNGNCLTFCVGGDRYIKLADQTVDSNPENDLIIEGQCRTAFGAQQLAGDVCVIGGRGYNGTPSCAGCVIVIGGCATSASSSCAGTTYILGGNANASGTGEGCGGHVVICGGDGTVAGGNSYGGNIYLYGGVGAGGTTACGSVIAYYGSSPKFQTTTYGALTTGTHCASGSIIADGPISTTTATVQAVRIACGTYYSAYDCAGAINRMLGMNDSANYGLIGSVENTTASICWYLGGGYKHEFCADGDIVYNGGYFSYESCVPTVQLDGSRLCLVTQDLSTGRDAIFWGTGTTAQWGNYMCPDGLGNIDLEFKSVNSGGNMRFCSKSFEINSSDSNAVRIRSQATCDPYISFHCADGAETRIGYFRGCGTTNAMVVCNDGGAFLCLDNTTSYLASCGSLYVRAGTSGTVYVQTNTSEYGAIFYANSCAQLRYNNISKLCTVTNGICIGTNCGFGTDWVATSDCRLKCNIRPISNALSTVTCLCGVCYNSIDDENNENRIGLIAQDVDKILPEVVSHAPASEVDEEYGITDEKLGIKYDKLTAVLIEAVKEQQQQITCLQQELNELKNK